MIYSLPNTYISLPESHILSPRFYSTTPFVPSRDSLYLQASFTDSVLRTSPTTASSNDSAFVSRDLSTSQQGYDKSNKALSLRALDWTIGRFDLSIKQLFVSLQLWQCGTLSAAQVSDVFVRLTTDFNATIATLASYEIFVSEFNSFEERVRGVLEPCLNEQPPLPGNFQKCIWNLEDVMDDVLPRLASKHTAVKRMLE